MSDGNQRDVMMYTTLDCPRNAIRTRNVISSAQAREPQIKNGQTFLQDYAGFSGTVPEKRNASDSVFKCSTCACHWGNT